MNPSELTALMHAVLDGEATPAEARELDRQLASDSAARTEFDALQHLFADLARIPQGFPPEGLVASVMASLAAPAAEQDDSNQLYSSAGVIGTASTEDRGFDPGTSVTVPRVSQTGPYLRGDNMSNSKSGSFGKRKVWIGAGIAVAGVVVAMSTGVINFPPEGKDATGTIAPAQRYRAAQPGDDNVGGASGTNAAGTQTTQGGQVGNASAADANGRDAAGRDASGRDASGRDASGRDASGRDASGRDASGRDASGRDAAGRDASGRDAAGRDASGRDAAGRDASGRDANRVN